MTNGIFPFSTWVVRAAVISLLSLFWVQVAAAQTVFDQRASRTTYNAPGQSITFTIGIDSGSTTFLSLEVTSSLGLTYVCNPPSSTATNTRSECTATYVVTSADTVEVREIGTVRLRRSDGLSGIITDTLSPQIDIQVPRIVVNIPQAISFSTIANVNVAELYGAIPLVANASSGLPVTFSSTTPIACFVDGTNVRILDSGLCTIHADQAGDAFFNPAPTAVQSFLINLVSDTVAPIIIAPSPINAPTDPGLAMGTPVFGIIVLNPFGPTITPTFTSSPTAGLAPGGSFPLGTTNVIVRAEDAAGNVATRTVAVTITDEEDPTITVPANISVTAITGTAGASVSYTAPTATDNVGVPSGPTQSDASGFSSGSFFPVGTTTQTFTATDAAGNIGTASFTVTVLDIEPPTVNVPADIFVSVDPGMDTAAVTFSVGAFDNAPGVSLAVSPASGSSFPVGATLVSATATDASGNQTTRTFTVTVEDDEAPVVTIPALVVVDADPGQVTAVVTFSATVVDVVDGALTPDITSAPNAGLSSGSTFPLGSTTVTVSGTDAAGNIGSSSFIVIVEDGEGPVITVPADVVIGTDAGLPTAVVTFNPTALDAIDGAVTPMIASAPNAGFASGSAFPVGTTTVTVTAMDAAGNLSSDSFTVTVEDNEMPVVTVPSNFLVNADAGLATAVVTFNPTAADAVDGAISPDITSAPTTGLSSGSVFPIGTTTVTATATDAAGNIGHASFTVTVEDDEMPTVTVPADIVVNADAGLATAVVTFNPTVVDVVDGALTPMITSAPTPGLASGSAFPIGVTTVTVAGTDAAGNTNSASFTVTVEDNEEPVVTVPADIAIGTDAGMATAVVSFNPTVVDVVDGALTPVITTSPTAGLLSGLAFPLGTTTVTVAGTDAAGNTNSASFLVTVTDDQAPIFTSAQPDINLQIDFNVTTGVVTFPTPTASDNSGVVAVAQTQGFPSGSAFPLGTTLIEFTATDGAGLTATLQFNVSLSLTPPGTIAFVVTSPDDGTVTFSSSTSVLNTSVTVTGGSGSSGSIQLVPGTYAATYALPTGFGVSSASCSSASGSVNTVTQSLLMTFASGETYTCTLTSQDIAADTQEQIQNFMDVRGRLIVANQPDQGRRIARVNGDSNPNGVSMFGHSMNTGVSPFGIVIGEDRVQLSFSSASASADLLTARSDWDLWFESTFSRYETSYGEGIFGIVHAGADYRIASNAILGLGVQLDMADEAVLGSSATTYGLGWMVGPYFTARIGDGLYFDANLRYGRSNLEISPLGTYVDDVSTERWLASVALFGDHDYSDTLNIQPAVAINYFEETSEAYIDSLLVPIALVTTRFGEVEIGSRFTWSDPLGQYSTFFEVEGIYTFGASGTTVSEVFADTGLRGRLGLGGTMAAGTSGVVDYGINYDGLGDDSFEAISVTLGYSINY